MAGPDKQEPIAIVGAACRLAGEVSSLGTLWDMISKVKTGHCKVPADRWDSDIWHHPDPDRKGGISPKHGYFLKQDIGVFDAPFFSTTAKEAAALDPMKRLLLEVSYESIENAGIPVERLMNSKTGCYVGCMTNDYEMMSLHDIYDISHTAASATSEAMTANRVSWFFGLKGPSLTLDTACSSSLYALHLACQSLRLRETDASLVAGVNLMIVPNTMHQLSAMHMLSPEGISHTFDDRANGYGRGEGIGALIVKRLSDALRDGDTIRAVIRGTGANADGKTPSITQPSSNSQAELIRDTYEAAGLPLYDTDYFESHGTGTPVGDPIELSAIASTIGAARADAGQGPLYVGSIKPTVGHTEGCSGLAGIFKSILLLEQGKLVPTYGVENVNPKLKLEDWNLALPSGVIDWPGEGLRRISVNSFGFGGANAHAILDDAYHYLLDHHLIGNHSTLLKQPTSAYDSGVSSQGSSTPTSESDSSAARLFVITAKDKAGIQRVSAALGDALKSDKRQITSEYLEDLAYTLALRRTHHDFRAFSTASSVNEFTEQLSKGLSVPIQARKPESLVMVFTGQGAQWAGMGSELLAHPVFHQSVLLSQEYLRELGCAWNAIEELTKVEGSQIAKPEYSQTLCTVLQVALIDVLRSWSIQPVATVGHSSGEIAAAYAAFYLTHRDAIRLAYVRGISSASVPQKGAMMAAGVSAEEAKGYLQNVPMDSAVVACVNSPSSVTLSGDVSAIDQLEKELNAAGKFARKLKVETAYHSPHMLAVQERYLEMIGKLEPQDLFQGDSRPVMYSSLKGCKITDASELNAQYWVDNMTNPVQFSGAVTALLGHTAPFTGRIKPKPIRIGAFVEIGPHAALQGPVGQIIANNKVAKEAPYVSMVSRGKDAINSSFAVAGKLWASGYDIDLAAVNRQEKSGSLAPKSLTDLPPYAWNHNKRFWHESFVMQSHRFPQAPRHDLVGQTEDLPNRFEPRWRNHLRITENPWIEDHRITGTTLYPGAGMLIMAIEGALRTADQSRALTGFNITRVNFERGLVVPADDEAAIDTRLSLHRHDQRPDSWEFAVYSMSAGRLDWTRHCSGRIALVYKADGDGEVEAAGSDVSWQQKAQVYKDLLAENSDEDVDVDNFYDHLETIGMQYGPMFRNVVALKAVPSKQASYGEIIVPDTQSIMPANYEPEHVIHPATMDAIFHIVLAAFNGGRPIDHAAVPYSIDQMYVSLKQPKGPTALYQGYGQLTSKTEDGHEVTGDLVVSDTNWAEPRLTVKNFALREVTSQSSQQEMVALSTSEVRKCAGIEWQKEIVSTNDQEPQKIPDSIIILQPEISSSGLQDFIERLAARLAELGASTSLLKLSAADGDAQVFPGATIISLLEIEDPLIYSWSETDFNTFKTMVSACKSCFWITRGGLLQSWSSGMEFAPAQGLLRVMRNEYPICTLPHLDLSTEFDLASKEGLESILHVWRSSLEDGADTEYAENSGDVYVARAVDDVGFDHELNLAFGRAQPVRQTLASSTRPLKPVRFVEDRESIWTWDNDHDSPLGADELEIQVEWAGLESTQAPQPVVSRQAVGRITRCGEDVTAFEPGHHVIVFTNNALRTHVRQTQSLVAPLAADMPPEAAATMPSSFMAAQYALDAARLTSGQTILIHDAASPVGQAVLQISQQMGVKAFCLASSAHEASVLSKVYGVSPDHIFDARLRNFVPLIDSITNGSGVDVVFCKRDSPAVDASLMALGIFGCFLDLTGGSAIRQLPLCKRNASLLRIDMDHIISCRADVIKDTFKRVFGTTKWKPIRPSRTCSPAELGDAVAGIRENSLEPITVSLQPNQEILVPASAPPELQLDPTATYILAGGLGALGLNIADWMVVQGAKHLVFLSRSGGSKNEKELAALRARGTEAEAYKCDVTDALSVATVFEQLRSRGCSIRGVIQCAMVLDDTIFDNMSHGQWQRAFNPKTRGSRNLLANLWSRDRPFMILLSSITGIIGNTAQANYASGNTFEDALAQHARSHLDIAATSIDVGLVDDSSHFTGAGEFGDLDNYLGKYGHGWHGLRTNLDELRVAMQAIMRGSTASGHAIPAQVVLGLGANLILQEGASGFQADKKFCHRVINVEETDASGRKKESVAKLLSQAGTIEDAASVVEESIKEVIAHAIGLGVQEIDAQKPLFDYGVDSLKAVEIRNKVLKDMQSEVSVFELLSSSPLAEVSGKVAAKSALVKLSEDDVAN